MVVKNKNNVGGEYKLAEWPCIEYLQSIGYTYLDAAGNEAARDRLNEVLLKSHVIDAIVRINGVSEQVFPTNDGVKYGVVL